MTPGALAGASIELKMQRRARRWVTVKTVPRTISAGGACSWPYKPARKGSYRVRATMVQDGDAHGRDHDMAVVQGQVTDAGWLDSRVTHLRCQSYGRALVDW